MAKVARVATSHKLRRRAAVRNTGEDALRLLQFVQLATRPTAGLVLAAREQTRVVQVSAGPQHTLFVTAAGRVFAAGSGDGHRLGVGDTTTRASPAPVDVPARVTAVSAGGRHSVALDSAGNLWHWGQQLPDAPAVALPVQAAAVATDVTPPVGWPHRHVTPSFTRVDAGWDHTLAVDALGGTWAWGMNTSLQLGLPSSVRSAPAPRQAQHMTAVHVVAVSAGEGASMVLDAAGDVHAWGANDSGQLGLPVSAAVEPQVVKSLTHASGPDASLVPPGGSPTARTAKRTDRAVSVSCGASHSVVALMTGQVVVLGRNAGSSEQRHVLAKYNPAGLPFLPATPPLPTPPPGPTFDGVCTGAGASARAKARAGARAGAGAGAGAGTGTDAGAGVGEGTTSGGDGPTSGHRGDCWGAHAPTGGDCDRDCGSDGDGASWPSSSSDVAMNDQDCVASRGTPTPPPPALGDGMRPTAAVPVANVAAVEPPQPRQAQPASPPTVLPSRPVQVAAGRVHTLILTEDGTAYAAGMGTCV